MTLLSNLIHSPSTLTTNKYCFVDTRELASKFLNAGFTISNSGKSYLRKPINPALADNWSNLSEDAKALQETRFMRRLARYNARLGHEKHFLRFTSDNLPSIQGHDMFLRVSNSYDGSSSLRISLDMMRLVCLNGLVAPRSIFETIITHKSKSIFDDAIEASYKIINKRDILEEQITKMIDTKLNDDSKLLLADTMLTYRFGNDHGLVLSENQKLDLLKPIRKEEQVDNLYQNFNTVQEKLTKGLRIGLLDASGKPIEMKVREVKGQVSADTFNNKSWEYAYSLVA